MTTVRTRIAENVPLTCLFCKHVQWYSGNRGYSEYTPGWNASIECWKKGWEWGGSGYEDELMTKLTQAQTCDMFELSDLAKGMGVEVEDA